MSTFGLLHKTHISPCLQYSIYLSYLSLISKLSSSSLKFEKNHLIQIRFSHHDLILALILKILSSFIRIIPLISLAKYYLIYITLGHNKFLEELIQFRLVLTYLRGILPSLYLITQICVIRICQKYNPESSCQ